MLSYSVAYLESLQALYRIVLVEAPLPVERFIANFCAEVPVPPPGRIQVRFGFVSSTDAQIVRVAFLVLLRRLIIIV